MRVSDVLDRCYTLFNEEDATSPIYLSRAVLLDFVNACTRVLVENTESFRKYRGIRTEYGLAAYELPTDLHVLQCVWYDEKIIEASSIRKWSKDDEHWISKSGTIEEYALDTAQRSRIVLNKIPTIGGNLLIMIDRDKVILQEADGFLNPFLLRFKLQTEEFLLGEVATAAGGGTATIVGMEQDADDNNGLLFFGADVAGDFTGIITGDTQGSATCIGQPDQSSAIGGDAYTFNFVTNGGAFLEVTSGTLPRDFFKITGLQQNGEVVIPLENNILLYYSYYPNDLVETDQLPNPYRHREDIYVAYVMAHMYLVEAVTQDMQKVSMYIQKFSMLTGIDLTKLWTPQRVYTPEAATFEDTKMSVRLPDEY